MGHLNYYSYFELTLILDQLLVAGGLLSTAFDSVFTLIICLHTYLHLLIITDVGGQ